MCQVLFSARDNTIKEYSFFFWKLHPSGEGIQKIRNPIRYLPSREKGK